MRYEEVFYSDLTSIISNSYGCEGYTAKINGSLFFIDAAFINMNKCKIDLNDEGGIVIISAKKPIKGDSISAYDFVIEMVAIDQVGSIVFRFKSTQGERIATFWTPREDSMRPMEASSSSEMNTNEQDVFGRFMHYIIQSARKWECR